MRMVDPILMELESEAPITRRVLERIPEDKLAWRPHPKSMSLGRLAMHVAEINSAIAEMTLADSHDFGAGPRREGTSRAEILEVFDKGFLRAKEIVANTDDARAMGEWTALVNGNKIMSIPRIGVMRTIMMNHLYHHRGQLSVYLRLLDVPVPSIYGPSADNNPFAKAA
ncbi:MAG: DinB family protein [Candidatus Sulfotelmatobacter sp.]